CAPLASAVEVTLALLLDEAESRSAGRSDTGAAAASSDASTASSAPHPPEPPPKPQPSATPPIDRDAGSRDETPSRGRDRSPWAALGAAPGVGLLGNTTTAVGTVAVGFEPWDRWTFEIGGLYALPRSFPLANGTVRVNL